MEALAVDDDICILKHETAYGASGESPVSVCAGDESVASHFALVTAYEDIKKRLRDTERENTLLRKRVKQLEDKLFRPEAPPSEGPQYVNKAFSAYRGIYMEKEDLQLELNKLKQQKSDFERMLTEQLQAKELEILQMRSEMETSQVMKSLNSPDYWQVDRVNTELKIHTLQEELERMTLENSRLLEERGDHHGPQSELNHEGENDSSSMQQSYEALCCEISRLHTELKLQSNLVRKLRPLLNRPAASTVPIQCLDDVEKNHHHHHQQQPALRVSGPRAPAVPSSAGRPCPPAGPPSGPPLLDGLRDDCWNSGPWSAQHGSGSGGALGGNHPCSALLPPPPLNQASLDDSSWSFPSPPKPSDALFWEGRPSSPPAFAAPAASASMGSCANAEWAKPY